MLDLFGDNPLRILDVALLNGRRLAVLAGFDEETLARVFAVLGKSPFIWMSEICSGSVQIRYGQDKSGTATYFLLWFAWWCIVSRMPRCARIVIPGMAHHITQRGNNRQDVFFVDGDRARYVGLLRQLCKEHDVRVLAYCLMTNHVHLVATPSTEESLNLAIGRTHFLYAQYVNRLHGRSGHLWQGRFHSCPMDDNYTLAAVRYVERNPVRARMTRLPWTYRWSSAGAHTGGPDASGLLDLETWRALTGRTDWKDELVNGADDTEQTIRLSTCTGRPLASDSLLSKLETALGRRLRPLPVGRPRKGTRRK